jgi:hypothetical protein
VLAAATLVVAGCGSGSGKKKSSTTTAGATSGGVTSNTTGTTSSSSPGTTGSSSTGTTGSSAADAPRIAAVSPGNGPVDGGTAVIVSGSNFLKSGAGTTLVLFGTKAVVVTPVSDTELQVTAPMQASAGAVDIRVVNDLGNATLAGAFTYDPRQPSLTVSPLVGCYDQVYSNGTKITLDVQGLAPLTSAATVDFGGTAAAAVRLVDPDTLVAEVPDGLTPGTVQVTVTDGSQTVSAGGFLVQGTPGYGDLTINEVLADPGGVDANGDGAQSGGNNQTDEFVEIVNTSAQPIDLSHLTLWKTTTSGRTNLHAFPNPTTLPAGGVIVLFSGGEVDERFGPRHSRVQAQRMTSSWGGNFSNSGMVDLSVEDSFGAVLFRAQVQSPGAGLSLNNANDGQKISANPATTADYVHHDAAQGATTRFSPGTKADGSAF